MKMVAHQYLATMRIMAILVLTELTRQHVMREEEGKSEKQRD